MASIQSSRAGKYARRGLEEDEPPAHLESAGELLIKQLVQKQTNTSVTLDQQLREEKKFERGVGFVALNELTAGTSSLKQFKEKKQQAERVGDLEGKGLTREEALVLVTGKRKSRAAPEAQAAKQQFVKQCLINKELLETSNSELVKRQVWELATSVKPNSVETRLYQFAVGNASVMPETESLPPDHPVHQLAAMEQTLHKNASADPLLLAKTIRRKRRQLVEAMGEPQEVHYKAPDRLHSLWDATERPVVVNKKPQELEKIASCKKQTLYTVKRGEIVQLGEEDNKRVENVRTEPKCNLNGQAFIAQQTSSELLESFERLSEEEIKKLPRFSNYIRGNRSKTLYIKNLSYNLVETELASIFNRFQDPNEEKIIFRLMTGKLRGQAFVTFASCEKAMIALETMNGSVIKGKPMVIQYGRQQD